jgi:preprotein translocase subunit SecA
MSSQGGGGGGSTQEQNVRNQRKKMAAKEMHQFLQFFRSKLLEKMPEQKQKFAKYFEKSIQNLKVLLNDSKYSHTDIRTVILKHMVKISNSQEFTRECFNKFQNMCKKKRFQMYVSFCLQCANKVRRKERRKMKEGRKEAEGRKEGRKEKRRRKIGRKKGRKERR